MQQRYIASISNLSESGGAGDRPRQKTGCILVGVVVFLLVFLVSAIGGVVVFRSRMTNANDEGTRRNARYDDPATVDDSGILREDPSPRARLMEGNLPLSSHGCEEANRKEHEQPLPPEGCMAKCGGPWSVFGVAAAIFGCGGASAFVISRGAVFY